MTKRLSISRRLGIAALCCAVISALHYLVMYRVGCKRFPAYPPSFAAEKPWDIAVIVIAMPSKKSYVKSFIEQVNLPWPVTIQHAVVPEIRQFPGSKIVVQSYTYRDRSKNASSAKIAGVTLSHVLAAQRLLQSKHTHALVFEDDNVLAATRQDVLDTIAHAPADASFINLSPCGRMVRRHAYDNYYYDGGSMCLNAYLMDRNMAYVWQSQGNPHSLIDADYVTGMVAYTQLLPSYHVHPPLFKQQRWANYINIA